MNHLGKRSGYNSVVWRAGCWGGRGVEAIQDGAFQRVSAHLAVDAIGGKFWQLMLAERALQAACGAEREIKVFRANNVLCLNCQSTEVSTSGHRKINTAAESLKNLMHLLSGEKNNSMSNLELISSDKIIPKTKKNEEIMYFLNFSEKIFLHFFPNFDEIMNITFLGGVLLYITKIFTFSTINLGK